MQGSSVSILVPVLNSAATLKGLAREVVGAMEEARLDFELIFINDASEDDSWSVLEGLHAADPRLRAIELEQRAGQHAALLCGLRAATKEVAITMDDDLEHPPACIPRLLQAIEAGADLVYGSAERRLGPPWRSAGAFLARLLLARSIGLRAALGSSPFRALRTELRDGIPQELGPGPNLEPWLTARAKRIEAVKVPHRASQQTRTRYGLRGLVRLGLASGNRRHDPSAGPSYRVRRRLPRIPPDGP